MFNLAALGLTKLFTLAVVLKPGTDCSINQVGSGSLFFLPHWWEYIKNFQADALGQCQPNYSWPDSIFPVGLALLDIMLRVAGFVAVIMIIISGIQYIIAQGNSESAGNARRVLYNALIGLGICFAATLIVAYVGNVIKT